VRRAGAWHLITGEYPPMPGGVADYTLLVAGGLADAAGGAGVHVWSPRSEGPRPAPRGVEVHDELGSYGLRDLARLGRALSRFAGPRRLLVQWVPHAYGWKSLNVPFCAWVLWRARRHGDVVDLVVHEPYLPFVRGRVAHNVAAAVHRLMIVLLLQGARRVWITVPAWERRLRKYTLARRLPIGWLPVPSNIPALPDPVGAASVRGRYLPRGEGQLVGHFGTFGEYARTMLARLVPALLDRADAASMVLIGPGSVEAREALVRIRGDLARRIHAAGRLPPHELSRHLGACDLMIQPYEDGASARRGSLMAPLEHGRPIVTTTGPATEAVWEESGAVALVAPFDAGAMVAEAGRLLADDSGRAALGAAARRLYAGRFDVRHTVATLASEG
jgi:glycosyltransferase involved in cell wall biosynthesis